MLLNLKDLGYIDSVGIASLPGFFRKLEGMVFFSNLPPKVSSIFRIFKLEKLFKIYDCEEEALREEGTA